jgi:hypothetical protein
MEPIDCFRGIPIALPAIGAARKVRLRPRSASQGCSRFKGWLLLSQQSRLIHPRSISCTLSRGAKMVLYEPVANIALPGQPGR